MVLPCVIMAVLARWRAAQQPRVLLQALDGVSRAYSFNCIPQQSSKLSIPEQIETYIHTFHLHYTSHSPSTNSWVIVRPSLTSFDSDLLLSVGSLLLAYHNLHQ
ncbi:hypothetical protein BDR07DRAFT_937531 [Suillus spraguei]|nr:hypothetical protein BDR07DRAFT_937531 [Suillus spraguei]